MRKNAKRKKSTPLRSREAQQGAALPLLLQNVAISRVAQEIGVEASTVYRWMQDAAFRERLDTLRRERAAQMRLYGLGDAEARLIESPAPGRAPWPALPAEVGPPAGEGPGLPRGRDIEPLLRRDKEPSLRVRFR